MVVAHRKFIARSGHTDASNAEPSRPSHLDFTSRAPFRSPVPCLQIVPLRVVLPSTKEVAMGKHSEKDDDEPKGGRPGPADHGREGGMATRENAPELTEPDSED
jgi:hypothetical protein